MKLGPVRRALAAACVLPLLLAGCTEAEPTPEMPDPTTSSPTATETESGPVEPTLPPEAEGDDKEAAAAFVEHYYAYINYAQETGDVTGLRDLGLSSCKACTGVVQTLREIANAGGRITGGENSVDAHEAVPINQVGKVSYFGVTASISRTAQTVSGAGKLDGDYAAGSSESRYVVVRAQTGGTSPAGRCSGDPEAADCPSDVGLRPYIHCRSGGGCGTRSVPI